MLLGIQTELSMIMLDLNMVILLLLTNLKYLVGPLPVNLIYMCSSVIFIVNLVLTRSYGLTCFARSWAWHKD